MRGSIAMNSTYKKFSVALLTTAFLSGCSLAPDFTMPALTLPDAFKQATPDVARTEPLLDADAKGEWEVAVNLEPSQRGEWWRFFGDEALNALQTQAQEANPELQKAASRLEQSRALVRASASTILPKIEVGGNVVRAKSSSAGNAAFGGNPNAQLPPYTLYGAGAVASYELDIFGRVRDSESALIADATQQEAIYRSVLLALQADVADHYFTLRSLDAERALLRDTLTVREEAQRIMQRRFEVGAVGEQDLSRTKAELAATSAELLALDRTRNMTEHALATLLGKMPSEFAFAEAPLSAMPPEVKAGLPSTLLQRRPDVSAAIAAMQAANKRIGVARTAYFPIINLTASAGVESNTLSDLFQWSSRSWALGQTAGSAVGMLLFDNGRTGARVDAAKLEYEQAVADYRTQVLAAFKEVENGLSEQRLLAEQSQKLEIAASAAKRTTELVQKRYDEGDVNYFEVVDAQRNSLAAQLAAIQAHGQRLKASVMLIRAVGGGWEEAPVKNDVAEKAAEGAMVDASPASPEATSSNTSLLGDFKDALFGVTQPFDFSGAVEAAP